LQCDYIIINGSMNGNIDTLRNEIKDFASSISFSGGRKSVNLDVLCLQNHLECLDRLTNHNRVAIA